MKFTFTDKKVNLPKSLHNYAEKKVGKLDRYSKTEAEANLVYSVEKERNKVDAAVTSMERQLRKHKTRLEKRLRTGAFAPAEPAEETSFVPDVEEDEFHVVRTKRFPIKPMTVDEAILQMNLLGHSFYAFKDEAGGAFAVVYKRNDGGYGLIEDEA